MTNEKTFSPFAVAVAQRTVYEVAGVQIWLDYLDEIGFDYVGLGEQNVAQLLPYIVKTANEVKEMNEARPVAVQNARILAALNKKTGDALKRVEVGGGNRKTRRSNYQFAKKLTPEKGKEIATSRQLAAAIFQKQAQAESDRIAAENPEFVEAVRAANAELNNRK
jgi:hypothetical protein